MNELEPKFQLFQRTPNLHIIHWRNKPPDFVDGRPENLTCTNCGGKFFPELDESRSDYARTWVRLWKCKCGSLPVEFIDEEMKEYLKNEKGD